MRGPVKKNFRFDACFIGGTLLILLTCSLDMAVLFGISIRHQFHCHIGLIVECLDILVLDIHGDTNPCTMGTPDDVDMVMRRNNTKSLRP